MVASPTAGAWRPTVTTLPGFVRSSTTSAVITFVMLAIGRRLSALRSKRISPVFPFATSTAIAEKGGGSDALAVPASARTSETARAKRRRIGRSLESAHAAHREAPEPRGRSRRRRRGANAREPAHDARARRRPRHPAAHGRASRPGRPYLTRIF